MTGTEFFSTWFMFDIVFLRYFRSFVSSRPDLKISNTILVPKFLKFVNILFPLFAPIDSSHRWMSRAQKFSI